MNEQFFTIALKAIDFRGAVDIDTELKLTNSQLQKFAELIVRECADIAERNDGSCSHNWIKQHFGVE